MGIEIITPRERIEKTVYALSYIWNDSPGQGFNFECDAQGNYIQGKPEGHANYLRCKNGEIDVYFEGVLSFNHSYTQHAIGRCSCGGEVHLSGFTNECEDCDLEYNMSGQQLAHRDLWDEDDRYDVEGPQNCDDGRCW